MHPGSQETRYAGGEKRSRLRCNTSAESTESSRAVRVERLSNGVASHHMTTFPSMPFREESQTRPSNKWQLYSL